MIAKKLMIFAMTLGAVSLLAVPGLAKKPYVVGVSINVTGPASSMSAPTKDALDIYFKAVNAAGGINGHPVKLIFEDNAARPSRAAAHARKFVTQDKVLLMVNASLSSTFRPMIQVARRYKVPLYYAGAVCPREVFPPKPAKYQFCSMWGGETYDSILTLRLIKTLVKKRPIKLALVAMNIPLSRREVFAAAKIAKKIGMKVVEVQAIPGGTGDYTPFATRIKQAGADAVYVWAPWSTATKTLAGLRKLGWKGVLISGAHLPAEEDMARLKDPGFYVFTGNAFFVGNLPVHRRIKALAKKYGHVYPVTHLAEGWVSAMVLHAILKKVGWPATPKKVLAVMNKMKAEFRGLRGGPLVWTGNNHYRKVNYYRIYRWDPAKKRLVAFWNWVPIPVKK
jgi:ABC-type branched-subunit amino acid transport system substrate-binding protein